MASLRNECVVSLLIQSVASLKMLWTLTDDVRLCEIITRGILCIILFCANVLVPLTTKLAKQFNLPFCIVQCRISTSHSLYGTATNLTRQFKNIQMKQHRTNSFYKHLAKYQVRKAINQSVA